MTNCLPISLNRIIGIACGLIGVMAAILMTPRVAAQQPAFLTNGLVAYYPFNGNVNDESGNGNDGRSTFAPFVSDRFNRELKSIHMNRSDFRGSRVLVPNSDSLNIVGDITLSAWVNTYDDKLPLTLLTIISKGGENGITYLFGVYYRRFPSFESVPYFVSIANGSGYQYAYSDTAVMPTNQWVHLVCVLNGDKCSTFINGNSKSVNTIRANSRSSNTNDVKIGLGDTPETGFSGQIDDIRIYNRALSNSEIKSLYSYESTPPNPVNITSQPASIITDLGKDVSFSVSATNATTYQWFKDGRILTGETNSDIHITYPQFNQTGSYSVLVSNEAGSIESESAKLRLRGGRVVAWGGNNAHGSTTVPAGLEDVVAVSAGYNHSLALKSDGTVVAWGANWDGRSEVPKGLSNIVSIFTPYSYSFAIDKSGNLYQWGSNFSNNTPYKNPIIASNVVSMTVGNGLLLLDRDHSAFELPTFYNQDITPPDLNDIIDIAGDIGLSLAVKRNGTVIAWGYQDWDRTNVPPDLKNVAKISTRGRHSLALKNDGTVVSWGMRDYGATNVPIGLNRVISISAGSWHSLALRDDNTIIAWGDNRDGLCNIPKGLKGVIAISAGEGHNLAIVSDSLFPPVIKQNITSLTVDSGQSAEFKIEARNAVSYQWFKDGKALSYATNSVLSLTNARPTMIGDYYAVASNTYGTATSSVASLNFKGVDAGIWKGLVGWYPLKDNIKDNSVFSNDGVSNVLPLYGKDRFGNSESIVSFNAGQTIAVKEFSGSEDSQLSVTFWFKPEFGQLVSNYIVSKQVPGSITDPSRQWGVGVDSNGKDPLIWWEWWVLDAGKPRFINSYYKLDNSEKWNHVSICWSGARISTYVNGILLGSKDAVGVLAGGDNDVRISGVGNGILPFYGMLDGVRIYNRGLSAADVAALYDYERVPNTVIIRQPQPVSVAVGGSVRLEVEASNPIPTVQLAYQWFKGGAKLVGATNSTLNLGQLRAEQIGTYTVTVGDGSRTLTSSAANVSLQGVDSSIWKGLIASYAFEGDFSDSSGFGDSLVPYGVVNFVDQGRRPETKVARVTGLNGFLVGPERVWFFGVEPRTVSIWIKPEATATNVATVLTLGGLENCAQRFSLQMPVAQNGIRFDGGDCTNGLRSKTFTGTSISGKWTHSVLTYDGASVRCYVNGLASGTVYTIPLNTDPMGPLVIGNTVGADGEGFTGLVDDVRIYNRSLSATEVRALFNYESTGVAPSLPQITRQPTPVSGYEGETLKISVEASGYQLGYQWQRGGQNLGSDVRLLGINSSELQIKGARLDDGGDYRVLVTNSFGAVTSTTVKLTVVPPVRSLVAGLANEVQEGQRIVFPLSMMSTGDVGGLTFKLTYNPAFLTDPNVEWSAVVGQSVNSVNTSVAGEISGSFSLPGTALASGTAALGTVDFRARSVPAQTNVVLSPAIASVANPSGTLLATGNGAISGEGRIRPRKIKGDNNANQRIDIGDAVVISRLLVGSEETRSWDVGLNDLNASQSMDNGDVIKALRTVVGLDPQPSPGSEGKRLASALGLAKVVVNTNDVIAIELLDGPKATVGQPYRVVVRLNLVKGSLSGLSFALKYPGSLTLTDKQVGALVPGDALPFWNESLGQVSLAAIRSTVWANSTGVAAVLTFVPSAGFSAQAEWLLKLEQVEITGSGFDVRPVDPVSITIQSGGGPVNTPPKIALQPPSADGSLTLEIRAPQGATVALETTGDLNTWVESQRITGQGADSPVKITLQPDPNVQTKFWRVRVRL